jgi:hypothetical protein
LVVHHGGAILVMLVVICLEVSLFWQWRHLTLERELGVPLEGAKL